MAELSRIAGTATLGGPRARGASVLFGARTAVVGLVLALVSACGASEPPLDTATPDPTSVATSAPETPDASGTSSPAPTVVAEEPEPEETQTTDPADLVPAEDQPSLIGSLADEDLAWELTSGDLIDLPAGWEDTTAELIAAGAGWSDLAGMWTLDGASAFDSDAVLYVSALDADDSASTPLGDVVDEYYLPGYEASGLAIASRDETAHPRGYDAVRVELEGKDASVLIDGRPARARHTLVVLRDGSRELALEFLRYGAATGMAPPDAVAEVVASFVFDER